MQNHPTLIGSLCVATVIATMPTADAASKFDGMWSAVFRTKSGPCQPAYRGAVQVVDGVIQIASTAGSLSGRVSRNGSVSATGYMGANTGVASGRVSGNFGSGTIMSFEADGDFRGLLLGVRGGPIVIDGLWALSFGNGGKAGTPDTLFFTAGPDHESHGLFGSLTPVRKGREGDHGDNDDHGDHH